jgi:hypothetical protein
MIISPLIPHLSSEPWITGLIDAMRKCRIYRNGSVL